MWYVESDRRILGTDGRMHSYYYIVSRINGVRVKVIQNKGDAEKRASVCQRVTGTKCWVCECPEYGKEST